MNSINTMETDSGGSGNSVQKINYERAKTIGLEIQQLASTIQTQLNNVSNQMNDISGTAWKSANAATFKSDFETLAASFTKVFNAIDTMGQALKASGTAFEEMQ